MFQIVQIHTREKTNLCMLYMVIVYYISLLDPRTPDTARIQWDTEDTRIQWGYRGYEDLVGIQRIRGSSGDTEDTRIRASTFPP